MKLFSALVVQAFKRQITYRIATVAGIVTNFFFGLLRVAVLVALYGSRNDVAGISLDGAITYTGLTQAIIAYLSLFSWFEIMNLIASGDVSSDLLKPVDFFRYWMAIDLGRASAQLLLRGAPIMVAYALIFDIQVPRTPIQWGVFLLALFLAWLLSFSWRFLVNLAGFWVPNAIGIGRLVFTFSWFFSGFLMPLRFFPDWFIQMCYLTPFPHTINVVVEAFLGVVEPGKMFALLLSQLVWILALFIAGQITLQAGVRRLVIQGG